MRKKAYKIINVQAKNRDTHSATYSSGVQEVTSASGMTCLFKGVSKVTLKEDKQDKLKLSHLKGNYAIN